MELTFSELERNRRSEQDAGGVAWADLTGGMPVEETEEGPEDYQGPTGEGTNPYCTPSPHSNRRGGGGDGSAPTFADTIITNTATTGQNEVNRAFRIINPRRTAGGALRQVLLEQLRGMTAEQRRRELHWQEQAESFPLVFQDKAIAPSTKLRCYAFLTEDSPYINVVHSLGKYFDEDI
jgi:hypothetical protein